MRDLKNRRRSKYAVMPLWGLCAAALLFAAGSTAVAQTTDSDAPIRLVPLEEIVAPDEISPPQVAIDVPRLLDVEDLGAPEPALESDSAQVEVGTLGEINADDVGLLNEQSGGFPDSLWLRTRRDIVTLRAQNDPAPKKAVPLFSQMQPGANISWNHIFPILH